MSKYHTLTSEKNTIEDNNFSIRKNSIWKIVVQLLKTKKKRPEKNKIDVLRFEISSEKMNLLLSNHQICAADIRCLDENSKHCLKNLCLQACLHNISSACHLPRG